MESWHFREACEEGKIMVYDCLTDETCVCTGWLSLDFVAVVGERTGAPLHAAACEEHA